MKRMSTWAFLLRALLVGLACAALQPEQPESVIGSLLLITAFMLTRD